MDAGATRHNRELWDGINAAFAGADGERRWRESTLRWGLFGRAEDELGLLGDVSDLDVVELGCGTASLSAWLTRRGARAVGVDLSPAQLRTARGCQERWGPPFPLVVADGEAVPLGSSIADVVVSEHGVAAWCEPDRWVAEAARILRPGGRLVFITNSVLSALCVPDTPGPAGDRLLRGMDDVRTVIWDGGGLEHHPSHGEWIDVLRRHGLVVEALHELRPPGGSTDPDLYEIVTADWAQRWPAEDVWVARASRSD